MVSVIVVEDNVDSMGVLCEFLQIKDLDVIGRGKNGQDAIKLYNQLHPDAVIMDVMMPEFDGYYGLEGIKKMDSNAVVVMVTADKTDDTRNKLMELNASAILYKPNDVNKIKPTVETLVSKKVQSIKF
jgi:two-component system chemotaxis response regulator CheY/two-component system response regulator (stage 0 sporulation protein A)